MMKRKILVALFSLLTVLKLSVTAYAHGVRIEYSVNLVVEIRAAYDTGEPMAGGQVTIYAPNDLSTPWMTGICDEQGHFTFSPDTSIPGIWDIQVRQSGHGDIVHIPIGEELITSGGTSYSTFQIVLMAACVIWGMIGTAFYFSRRSNQNLPNRRV